MERDDAIDARERDRESARELQDTRDQWRLASELSRGEIDDFGIPEALRADPLEYDWPKCLEDRAQQDVELLSKLNGLKPEVWQKASVEARLETLRDAERQLAALQGREPFRTYMVPLFQSVDGAAGRHTPQPVYYGSVYSWSDYAEGNYIHIEEKLLHRSTPEYTVEVFAHESFHAFQLDAIRARERPMEQPRMASGCTAIDAEIVAQWRESMRQPVVERDAPLEQHAEHYGLIVSEGLYPSYWSRASGT